MKLLRWLKWWWTDGPKRLKAARLRRQGDLKKAMQTLFGYRGTALLVIECIKIEPDPERRTRIYRQAARYASAGVIQDHERQP